MKETIDLLGKILTNILTALYEPFGFSLLDCEDLEEVVFEGKLEEIGYDVFLRSNPQISGLNLPLKESGGHVHSY